MRSAADLTPTERYKTSLEDGGKRMWVKAWVKVELRPKNTLQFRRRSWVHDTANP